MCYNSRFMHKSPRTYTIFLIAIALTLFTAISCTAPSTDQESPSNEQPDETPSSISTRQDPTATRLPEPTPTTPPSPTSVPLVSPTATPTVAPTSTPIIPSPTSMPTATPVVLPEPGTLRAGVISSQIVAETLPHDPTATPTPFPTIDLNFGEITPTPESLADLQPYFGQGQPIRVRNPKGGPMVEKSDLVVDFFVTNAGKAPIRDEYMIDLYIDDKLAQRWFGIWIDPGRYIYIEGATGLLDLIDLEPGEHTVTLVIDPTNLVAEISDKDNTYSQKFTWDGPPLTPPTDEVLPNLSMLGNSTGILIAPYVGASESGGLSALGDTSIVFAALNDSRVSIDQDFSVMIMFDDVVMFNLHYDGLVSGRYAYLVWEDLARWVRVTPGEHKISLIVDPTNVIHESNEGDNRVDLFLTWGTHDPISEPQPTPSRGAPIRETQILANLTGVIPFGWDDAISVHSLDGSTESPDGQVFSESNNEIRIAIRNSSRVPTPSSGSFEAHLYVDGHLHEVLIFESGDDAGKTWEETIRFGPGELSPGQHLIEVHIDPTDDIPEFNDEDNFIGRWFEVSDGLFTAESSTEYNIPDAELRKMLAIFTDETFLSQVRRANGSALELPNWEQEINDAARAGYYLLTGRNLNEERVVVNILPHDQFVAASFNACMTDYFLETDDTYVDLYEWCSIFGGEIGFKYRLNWKIHIFIDLSMSPIEALGVYFHELGHAYQDIINPEQSESELRPEIRPVYEAEAQAFEAAAFRKIEEFLGIKIAEFPNIAPAKTTIESLIDSVITEEGSAIHAQGYKLLWREILNPSSEFGLAEQVAGGHKLTADQIWSLFNYIAKLTPDEALSWQNITLGRHTLNDIMLEAALLRLIADLPNDRHANGGMLTPTFLVP